MYIYRQGDAITSGAAALVWKFVFAFLSFCSDCPCLRCDFESLRGTPGTLRCVRRAARNRVTLPECIDVSARIKTNKKTSINRTTIYIRGNVGKLIHLSRNGRNFNNT